MSAQEQDMKDIMVDIETLGIRASAAIIQIGAVAFDRHTGDIDEPFLVSIAQNFYEDEATHGFTKDASTMAWWAKQSKGAQQSLTINKVSTPFIAMDKFGDWLDSTGFEPSFDGDAARVWANPPAFDLVILRHAHERAYGTTAELPWKHTQETDLRTLKYLLPQVKQATADDMLIPHRADHDAIRQAMLVIEYQKLLHPSTKKG